MFRSVKSVRCQVSRQLVEIVNGGVDGFATPVGVAEKGLKQRRVTCHMRSQQVGGRSGSTLAAFLRIFQSQKGKEAEESLQPAAACQLPAEAHQRLTGTVQVWALGNKNSSRLVRGNNAVADRETGSRQVHRLQVQVHTLLTSCRVK